MDQASSRAFGRQRAVAASSPHASEAAWITLRGILNARWALLAVLAPLAIVHGFFPHALGLHGPRIAPTHAGVLVVTWAIINLVGWLRSRTRRSARSSESGVQLLMDVAGLTLFFVWSGAAANPFTILYLVPITLATQVSVRWTWGIAAAGALGFASLFAFPAAVHHSTGHGHFSGHLAGMWVALVASGVLITLFVHRIATALAAQREELVRLRREATEARHVAMLGGLAAGAAHELGTPLGTIQLLVGDLSSMNDVEREQAVHDIEAEVMRCKRIVDDMANPELGLADAREHGPWPLSELASQMEAERSSAPVAVHVSERARTARCTTPFNVVARVLRELVVNAARSCADKPKSTGVHVHFDVDTTAVNVSVRDDGMGMTPDVAQAAFAPFFSTRAEGRGLGLFLARVHTEQLGGRLTLESTWNHGTIVHWSFPRDTGTHERE